MELTNNDTQRGQEQIKSGHKRLTLNIPPPHPEDASRSITDWQL